MLTLAVKPLSHSFLPIYFSHCTLCYSYNIFLLLAYVNLILELVLCLLFFLPRTCLPQIVTWLSLSYYIEFCLKSCKSE